MRVLVIEDDEEMAEAVAVGLRRERMAVDVAVDGPSGFERAVANDYDVIVLDRACPACTGTTSVPSWSPLAVAAGC